MLKKQQTFQLPWIQTPSF